MNFITNFPRTTRVVDSIWVKVDRLTKSTHFIPLQESSSVDKLAKIYIKEVVARLGVLVLGILDHDVHYTSWFWRRFHEELG